MAKKVSQEKVKILANKKIGGDHFKLTLFSSKICALAEPGQFVAIRISDGTIPLLRRPFGVHMVNGKAFDCLIETVGPATKILSQKKPGEDLDVIGPLGNGFNYRPKAKDQRLKILVAGGMGVAPLVFLAEKMIPKLLVLIGAKTKKQIICEKEFQKLGCNVKIATDDGSRGFKGKVTELLRLYAKRYPLSAIYACGPKPMLEEIACVAKQYSIPAQISLEEHMSCGIGACLGCVVNTKDGFKRVCKEGPVFAAEEIVWD